MFSEYRFPVAKDLDVFKELDLDSRETNDYLVEIGSFLANKEDCDVQKIWTYFVLPTIKIISTAAELTEGKFLPEEKMVLKLLRDYVKTVSTFYKTQNPPHIYKAVVCRQLYEITTILNVICSKPENLSEVSRRLEIQEELMISKNYKTELPQDYKTALHRLNSSNLTSIENEYDFLKIQFPKRLILEMERSKYSPTFRDLIYFSESLCVELQNMHKNIYKKLCSEIHYDISRERVESSLLLKKQLLDDNTINHTIKQITAITLGIYLRFVAGLKKDAGSAVIANWLFP